MNLAGAAIEAVGAMESPHQARHDIPPMSPILSVSAAAAAAAAAAAVTTTTTTSGGGSCKCTVGELRRH